MFSRGYWDVGRLRGAPVRVHWSAPLGAIAFTGFSFSPDLWAGFFLLVLLHELGHAALVRRLGYDVVAVRVHAFGGDCQWRGDPTRADVALIAWGGVLAQAIVWVAVTIVIAVAGWPDSFILASLAVTFTSTSARVILFNLLPIPPLDGHRAWSLLPILWEARGERLTYQREREARRRQKDREVAEKRARAAAKKELDDLDASADKRPPIPPEVQASLDRIARESQATPPRDDD